MSKTTVPAKPDRSALESLLAAIAKADTGDARALATVRDQLWDLPDLADSLTSLFSNAEAALLLNIPEGVGELYRRQAGNLRRELQQEGTGTALERMLIRRISLDFMATMQAERARSLAPGETRSFELSRFYDHQADRAHRRLLASVESLARVRKLITPIQINIAEQQVNVAGNVTTDSAAEAHHHSQLRRMASQSTEGA